MIVEKKLRAPRNTALSKIINAVAMTTLMSTKNAHNKFSSFSDKAMVIFVNGKAMYAPICEVLALKNPNESP